MNILILPSYHPLITTSSVYTRDKGIPAFNAIHLAVTKYSETSHNLIVPSSEHEPNLSETFYGYAKYTTELV